MPIIKKKDNSRYSVQLASGMMGWRQRIKGIYGTLKSFRNWCDTNNVHTRLDYATPETAWKANPIAEGGLLPEDYRRVPEVKQRIYG